MNISYWPSSHKQARKAVFCSENSSNDATISDAYVLLRNGFDIGEGCANFSLGLAALKIILLFVEEKEKINTVMDSK